MFVYPHKLMIKTCGATTLLKSLPLIMDIAKIHCGFSSVYRVFYSRKSFLFPERQVGPHRSWDEEVEYLDAHVQNGEAFVAGEPDDQWFLYLTPPAYDAPTHDDTIEILMTQLDRKAMLPFYQKPDEPSGVPGGQRVDRDTGLETVYPKAQVDSYLFEPCGYSANGLLDEGYYTIHVTPEPQCSYASFETTIPATASHPLQQVGKHRDPRVESARMLIRQVVDIFQPGRFTATYFRPTDDASVVTNTMDRFGGYKRTEKRVRAFHGYDFCLAQYTKI